MFRSRLSDHAMSNTQNAMPVSSPSAGKHTVSGTIGEEELIDLVNTAQLERLFVDADVAESIDFSNISVGTNNHSAGGSDDVSRQPPVLGAAADGQRSDNPNHPATARSGNAIRVARHKQKLAAAGIRQLNIRVPEAGHGLMKELARRLLAGATPEEALFDLAATVSAAGPDVAFGAPTSGGGLPAADKSSEEELVGRIQHVLRRGGWRAAAIKRLLP